MKKLFLRVVISAVVVLFIFSAVTSAQELKPIKLFAPQMDGSKSLMQTLKERKTTREFSSETLPLQVLSNLLWSAFGINRPEDGKRTAPSAMNWQEIDIYVATAEGLYLFDANIIPIRFHDMHLANIL